MAECHNTANVNLAGHRHGHTVFHVVQGVVLTWGMVQLTISSADNPGSHQAAPKEDISQWYVTLSYTSTDCGESFFSAGRADRAGYRADNVPGRTQQARSGTYCDHVGFGIVLQLAIGPIGAYSWHKDIALGGRPSPDWESQPRRSHPPESGKGCRGCISRYLHIAARIRVCPRYM